MYNHCVDIQHPEGLQSIRSHLSRDTTGGCTVNLQWALPEGFSEEDFPNFIVSINETDNFPSYSMTTYPLCDCAPHNVTIRVVDRCGRVSPNLMIITLDDPPAPPLPPQCVSTTTEMTRVAKGYEDFICKLKIHIPIYYITLDLIILL